MPHAVSRPSPIRRSLTAALFVLATGTLGYMWIEGWSFGQALFFTIITISTVGYGDYGLSETGLHFSAVLILSGLGVFTYAVSQLGPLLFNERAMQERRMIKEIRKLSDHIIVCGLGRVGRACCDCLSGENIPFVCIDASEEAIEWARDMGYLAIQGDATHDETLEQAGIRWARGFACVTESDTENIVITLGARQLNPELRIVSRAESIGAFQKMQRAGASHVISPVAAGGESIALALAKPHLSDMLERPHLAPRAVEFAEVTINDGSPIAGSTIRECGESHPNIVFIALSRAGLGTCIRPDIDKRIEPGDILDAAGDALAIGRLTDDARPRRAAA